MFELDDEQIAFVRDPCAEGDDALERAASRCPAGAIFLDEGGDPA